MIRSAPAPIRWWLKLTGFSGITLPPFAIYVLAEQMGNQRLRRHEEAHWEQYKRMGAVKFYAAYLWFTIRYGYWNNPLEVQAREAENDDGLQRP